MKEPVVIEGHSTISLKKALQKQLEDACLCDVALVVAGQKLHAHKCVLGVHNEPIFQVHVYGTVFGETPVRGVINN